MARPIGGSLQKEIAKQMDEIGYDEVSKWRWQHKELMEETG